MKSNVNQGRRRVPRRAFESDIGILIGGEYRLARSFQVGEGGMMISSSQPLVDNQLLVLSFFVHDDIGIIVRAIVRSKVDAQNPSSEKYGLEFQNLEFQFKREIRNFVASASS